MRYPAQMYDRVLELKESHNNYEIAEILNKEFGVDMDNMKVKSYFSNHDIKRINRPKFTYPDRCVFTEEQQAFMKANYKGAGPTEMVKRLNEKWNTNYTRNQVKGYYKRHGLLCGLTGRFEKGHTTWNKGKKIENFKPNAGCFKKGNMPAGHKEVGTVVQRSDGYWIKIAEPNVWEQYHRVIYKNVYGEIPPNSNVSFKDGNILNIDPDNLMLLSKAEHCKMTSRGYRNTNAEITNAGYAITKIESLIEERRKAK